MSNVLKYCTFLCLFIALPVLAYEGDYILEDRFKAHMFNAKDGEAGAQYAVGEMYHRGRGVEASDEEALYWFLLAAEQGNLKAAYKAAFIYLHSDTVPKSPRKAVPWLKLSAKAGYPAAQYELGLIYGTGIAGYRDRARAMKLLAKAKLAGYKPANKAFDRVVGQFVKLKTKSSRSASNKSKSVAVLRVAKPRFRPKVVKDKPDPRRVILARRWDSDIGPSTFLPSKITDCRELGAHIECMSSTLTKQVLNAEVVYRIRTRITNIRDNGQFRLAYANNVLSATNEAGTKAMNIKTGWQLSEHVMECSLQKGGAISCSRGSDRQFRFTGH